MNELTPHIAAPEQEDIRSLRERLHTLRNELRPEKKMDTVKLKKACQDFEAVFIGQIWKQMRASVPKDGMLHSKEEEQYLSMFDQELSVKMASAGGIGLSDMLYANLSQRLENVSRDTSAGKPLLPLRPQVSAVGVSESMGQSTSPQTLATAAAQRAAEALAQEIEQAHGRVPEKTQTVSRDLADALRLVSVDTQKE